MTMCKPDDSRHAEPCHASEFVLFDGLMESGLRLFEGVMLTLCASSDRALGDIIDREQQRFGVVDGLQVATLLPFADRGRLDADEFSGLSDCQVVESAHSPRALYEKQGFTVDLQARHQPLFRCRSRLCPHTHVADSLSSCR